MILRGIIANSFGGALCFRGFAKIGDLAKISASKDSYQRKVDSDRSKDILEFLKNSEFRFFPELVFGLNFNDTNAINQILQGSNSNFSDGISFTSVTKDYKDYSLSDKFNDPALRRINLDFKDDTIKHLSRIDGNHRLTSVDLIMDIIKQKSEDQSGKNIDESKQEKEDFDKDKEILDFYVPFNIILQLKNEDSERAETAYFHLINSKSKKLTSEENLKSIFKEDLFSESQIKELLGEKALFSRQLYENLTNYSFQAFDKIINGYLRSFCLDCINLFDENEEININKMQTTIQQLDLLFSEDEKLATTNNLNIILSFVYFKYKEEKNIFSKFKNWIISNQIFELDEIKAKSIIRIFKQVHEKRIYQIFVAMPYWGHQEVNEYNTLFKEICSATSKKLNVEVELIPIMRFRGKSKRIDARLIEKIKECDVFIADITGCNQNVIFEVGYAEGQDKPMILIKDEKDDSAPPFDMDKLQYIPYNKDVYYNAIKNIIIGNLAELLKKEFKIN